MIPSRNLEKLFGGILARYQEIFRIELYAYFFLSNHLHLLIRAPLGNTDEFCENLNREIARRMNWKLRREGKFWSRRYDDIPVGSEDDLLEAVLYVTTNATRHGLLEDSSEWPGLNSFKHILDERDREFSFYHYSVSEPEKQVTRHKLKLSVLPMFKKLSHVQRREKLSELLHDRMKCLAEDRRASGHGFLGLRKVISTTLGEIPREVSRKKRPECYTKCIQILREKRIENRLRHARYNRASLEYRLGQVETLFPEFSFKPPLHRRPRIVPFQPITADFLNVVA